MSEILRNTKRIIFLPSAARTASGNTEGTPVSAAGYQEASFFLNVTAASGVSPTLDVEIETQDPVSGEWFTLVTFTQATAVSKEFRSATAALGEKIACKWTIGGGDTPSFTFSLSGILKS